MSNALTQIFLKPLAQQLLPLPQGEGRLTQGEGIRRFLHLSFVIFNLTLLLALTVQAVEVSPLIAAIEVKGNQTVSEQEILNVVFSRIGDSLLEEKVRDDLKAVYGLGYFSDVNSAYESYAGGTKLIFIVKENPLVKEVAFSGNTVYSDKELFSMISIKAGENLNYKKLQHDIETINNKYKEDGYILAKIADVDTDEKKQTITFKIIEGRVEAITLDGNEQTKNYVILRELKTQAGDVLNQKTLKDDLRRVFNLGFFSEVNPQFEAGSAADNVIIVLKIKESRSSTINFGGGYGERDGWFGFVDLSVNNLMGTGQGMMIRGQAGQQLTTYQFKYSNPWFFPEKFGDHTSFTFKRWLTIGRDLYLTEQNGIYNGFDVAVGKPFLDDYKIDWSLGSETVDPYNGASFESYQSDTVGVTLSFDDRDIWLNPTSGSFYSLALKQGWKHSGGSTTGFFKIGTDSNWYRSITDGHVIASHVGTGIGFGDIPIGEEYWAGGANTVRGYYPSEAHKGTRKFIYNLEYRLNFSDMFQGVFFYDLGDAWYLGAPHPGNFISGWGPGVRVNTPLGPIRLDWGVPMGKNFGEGVMHFSIGQAF